ncbi:MAG: glycoside hydrolase family 127 protein, partial [Muribaculaceae bacterium]|nr:glycoside hydrolase family 127 protein [Muribaculaceae bacterium]
GLECAALTGDLAERVDRNFHRMETELYQPARVFWTEEESNGWPADKEGRTILALVLDSRAAGRKARYLDEIMAMLPQRLNDKGYMGTIHVDAVDEQQLSGHGWLLRGLCEYFEWTGDSTALKIARGVVDNLFMPVKDHIATYPIDPAVRVAGAGDMSGTAQDVVDGWRLSSDVGCVFIGMEGLIHYFRHDRRDEVKLLIDDMIGLFMRIDPVAIQAQTHASLTAMRGLLRYAAITGNKTLVDEVMSRWMTYKSDGMTENYENYNWFGRYDTWTEPCAIIDSYMVAVQLWEATRNPSYLDDAELIYYNGICATQRDNGGFGCNKPLGPCFDSMRRHCYEAHWCCTMRGGEGLGRAVDYTCYESGDTVILPFYHSGRYTLSGYGPVIDVTSDYPYGNDVIIRMETVPAASCVLSLRIPQSVADHYAAVVNGEVLECERTNGFVNISRRWHQGDEVQLRYAMEPRWMPAVNAELHNQGIGRVMYGPLVMADCATGLVLRHKPDNELAPIDGCRVTVDNDTLMPIGMLNL